MKRLILIAMLLPLLAAGQIRFSVTVPAGTATADTIFIAGSFNNWNPGSPDWALSPSGNGKWSILMPATSFPAEFKFTRGDWSWTEADQHGMYVPNRVYRPGKDTLLELTVLGWEDMKTKPHSLSANVSILSDSFYVPQLGRYRRIWIYLPPDYIGGSKQYPVLYMCDGQNLFDDATSYAGEWAVDEILNKEATEGRPVPIVVGIDHGIDYRMNEYSPWLNERFGGGEGEPFMQFLCYTLKPYVDSNYRTLPEPEHTAFLGASMGGLISLYGVFAHSDVIGAAGVFSPSLWFNDSVFDVGSYARGTKPVRVFLLVGGKEGPLQAKHVKRLRKSLQTPPLDRNSVQYVCDKEAGHNEELWKAHFIEALAFLLPGGTP